MEYVPISDKRDVSVVVPQKVKEGKSPRWSEWESDWKGEVISVGLNLL